VWLGLIIPRGRRLGWRPSRAAAEAGPAESAGTAEPEGAESPVPVGTGAQGTSEH
jgi:hypothetical protein